VPRMMKNLAFLFAIALLSSCTTFSKKECEQMDWSQRGSTAAMKGETLEDALRYYNRTCMDDNGVIPDQAAIQRGFSEGLKYFCRDNNIRAWALGGGRFPQTCEMSDSRKVAFKEGHQDFIESEVYRLRDEVHILKSRVSDLESENSNLKSELDRAKR
jgi:hypothetical protein